MLPVRGEECKQGDGWALATPTFWLLAGLPAGGSVSSPRLVLDLIPGFCVGGCDDASASRAMEDG